MAAFDSNVYCNFDSASARSIAGKDLLLAIFNKTGDKLLAISGQKSLTINRSADTIDISSKDTQGGWKSNIAGMKEWSIEVDGAWIEDDESHNILSAAFESSDCVCVKVINVKQQTSLFGGLACITDYPIEAPFDDSATYTITLSGIGALVDLTTLDPTDAGKIVAWPE